MMTLQRRDFLKLVGISPLVLAACTRYENHLVSRSTSSADLDIPNILVLVFDALSSKNMSLYGYERRTTPNIEKAAKNALVYHRHYAGANFTSPSTGSLFTGTYPWTHRSFNIGGTTIPYFVENNIFSLLQNKYRSLAYTHNPNVNYIFDQYRKSIGIWIPRDTLSLGSAEIFPGDGLRDWAFTNQVESLLFWRTPRPSAALFSTRFVHRKQQIMQTTLSRRFQKEFPRGVPNFTTIFFTIEDAIDWILGQVREWPQPYLAYIHLLPPHIPYNTRREFVDIFDDGWKPIDKPVHKLSPGIHADALEYQRRLYDEFIAYVDAEFGRLFEGLADGNVFKDTLLVLTSDHGEMFERGILAHDTPTLYEPIIKIPLLIWKPGQTETNDIHTLTSNVDLLPTLLHVAEETIPPWCEGQVLPGFGESRSSGERSVFAMDAIKNQKMAKLTRASLCMIHKDYKLIHYTGYPEIKDGYEFYNLRDDPEELQNSVDESDPNFIMLREALRNEVEARDRIN